MKKILTTAAIAAALAVGASAHAAQFVVNGDFTTLSNGVGQIDSNTVAKGWTSSDYNFVMTSGDVGSSGIYGGLSLWDANNGGSNSWDGLAAAGGNFVAMDPWTVTSKPARSARPSRI